MLFRSGTAIDADLAFYPGAAPLRALVVRTYPLPGGVPPLGGATVEEGLGEVAASLAADPWSASWPLLLREVVPGRTTLGGLPLHPADHDPWRLIAVSGGRPVTVAVEWTPYGLRPLSAWDAEGTAVPL